MFLWLRKIFHFISLIRMYTLTPCYSLKGKVKTPLIGNKVLYNAMMRCHSWVGLSKEKCKIIALKTCKKCVKIPLSRTPVISTLRSDRWPTASGRIAVHHFLSLWNCLLFMAYISTNLILSLTKYLFVQLINNFFR